MEDTKRIIIFEGKRYEEGSIEYKNLFLIEGRKEENKDTLLGLMSELYIQNPDKKES